MLELEEYSTLHHLVLFDPESQAMLAIDDSPPSSLLQGPKSEFSGDVVLSGAARNRKNNILRWY
jgi:hypothetical protein